MSKSEYKKAVDDFKGQGFDPGDDDMCTALCVLNPRTENKSNGFIRVLRNRENGTCRIVMRKNKTFDLLLNHYVPVTDVTNNQTVFKYEATDYIDGGERKNTVTFQVANDFIDEFRGAFEQAKKHNVEFLKS